MKVKSFHLEFDRHLRFKDGYMWGPPQVESTGRSVSYHIELDDGTVIDHVEHINNDEVSQV